MKPGTKKFVRKERKRALAALKQYLASEAERPSREMIAAHMNGPEGAPHPNGEWTPERVSAFMHTNRVRRSSSARAVPKEAPPPKERSESDRIAVAEIILAANLGNEEKEKILSALFQGGAR